MFCYRTEWNCKLAETHCRVVEGNFRAAEQNCKLPDTYFRMVGVGFRAAKRHFWVTALSDYRQERDFGVSEPDFRLADQHFRVADVDFKLAKRWFILPFGFSDLLNDIWALLNHTSGLLLYPTTSGNGISNLLSGQGCWRNLSNSMSNDLLCSFVSFAVKKYL